MLKRNDGVTFVEMMVVVTILGLMSIFVGGMLFSTSDWRSEQVSQKIADSLSETRTNALAKTSAWMQIKYKSGKYILSTSYGQDVELGSDRDFQISFNARLRNGTTETTYELKAFEGLVISYNRADGSFADVCSRIEEGTDSDGKTVYTPVGDSALTGCVCTSIVISQGDTEKGVLTLYPETGKYKLRTY